MNHISSVREREIHAAYREQLTRENERAEGLRARHAEITAKLDALAATRGASLIEHRYALALAKAAKKRKRKEKPLTDLPMFAQKGLAA